MLDLIRVVEGLREFMNILKFIVETCDSLPVLLKIDHQSQALPEC